MKLLDTNSMTSSIIIHGRKVHFERGCPINKQKVTNVEIHSRNNKIQKMSVFTYHIGNYTLTHTHTHTHTHTYIYLHVLYIYIYIIYIYIQKLKSPKLAVFD